MLKTFVVILAALAGALFLETLFGFALLPDMNQLRLVMLSVFSVAVAVWLLHTVRRIHGMPDLRELELMVQDRTNALQAIVDNSPVAIVQANSLGIISIWNRAAEKLFGWTAAEAIGNPVPMIPDSKSAEYDRNLADSLSNKINEGMMTQRKHKDGHLIDVCLWNAPLRSGKARETLAMAMFADMTREKKLHECLAEAKINAERANEAKSQFLAYMSHEIRTPLSAIVGFGELLLKEKLSEEQRQAFLQTVVRNGRSLALLIDDILDMSKVEAGEMQIDPRPVSVREVLNDVKETLELRAVAKDLTFECNISDRVPGKVLTDGLRLRQIVMNIAGNAIKFTTKGGVFIRADHAADFLKITVRDTGPGMTTEEQGKLFRSYSQVDPAICAKFGGTGLGLYLSRELCKLMNGHILIQDSAPGRGSTFEIQLEAPVIEAKPRRKSKKDSPRATASI